MRKWLAIAAALIAGTVISLVTQGGTASASAANCTSSLYHAHFSGSVNVPAGAECALLDSVVDGTVRVGPNAALFICGSTVNGPLDVTRSYVNVDNNSTLNGPVDLEQPGLQEVKGTFNCGQAGGPASYSSILCPKLIGGSLTIDNTPYWANEVSVGECGGVMPIGGSVDIIGNRALIELGYSVINGPLFCQNNHPTPDVFDTTIHGSIHGDCFGGVTTTTITGGAAPHAHH